MNRRNFLKVLGVSPLAVAVGETKPDAPVVEATDPWLEYIRRNRKEREPFTEAVSPTRHQQEAVGALLERGREVVIDPVAKTIRLRRQGVLAPACSKLSFMALCSHVLEIFNLPEMIDDMLPLRAITPTQFEFMHDWTFADQASREMVAHGAWTEGDDVYLCLKVIGTVPDNEPIGVRMGSTEHVFEQTGLGDYIVKWSGEPDIELFFAMRSFSPRPDGNVQPPGHTVSDMHSYGAWGQVLYFPLCL